MPGCFGRASAYRFTLEDSIYIDPAEIGRGIGRTLLQPVIERCAELRLPPDDRGDRRPRDRRRRSACTKRSGFAHIGVLPAIGFKFGRWIDIVLMQRAARRRSRDTLPNSAGTSAGHVARRPVMARDICRSRRRSGGYHAHIYYDPDQPPDRGAAARGDRRIASRSNSAAGTTSRSGRIRSRCIRSRSRPRNSRASCRG